MLDLLVDSAFETLYPLHAFARTRWRAVEDPANPGRHATNTLRHERQLSDHNSRWITSPNNDTLYSNAWLDLSGGPVRARVGAMPTGRYWSLAFMDAYTDHFAVVGQRLDGTGPVDITIVGPRYDAKGAGDRVLRAPGDDAWLFARCLVDGPEDLANAHAMQDRIEVLPSALVSAPRVRPLHSSDPGNFLDVVNESLALNPIAKPDRALLESWAAVGIGPGLRDAWSTIGEEARQAWTARLPAAHDKLRVASRTGRREVQGWFASAPEMGQFGSNHALRASVALGGLGALVRDEAMYFVKFQDEDGAPLDGGRRYLLRVPHGGIPTDSFWSFTMYEPTADSQRFLVENPIRRYSIGDRTPGLRPTADGSIDIAVQYDAPADATLRANWLPAPGGAFQIALRTYLPRAELRAGTAAMPRIVRA